jgi:molybdopterin/thiamine biosynthesis adenylyltransferase
MTQLYDRQKTLNLNKDISITVVGVGGVGYWVAKFAAMSGIEKIYLYDHDVIEEHNLNRLDLPTDAIGKNKAAIAKGMITYLRPDATVYSFPFKFKESLAKKTDWLIDCTDSSYVQEENQRIAKVMGMKYMKVGYNGEHITLSNIVAEWGETTNGYTTVPSWVVPASVVAALAVGKIMKYTDKELSANLKDLYI